MNVCSFVSECYMLCMLAKESKIKMHKRKFWLKLVFKTATRGTTVGIANISELIMNYLTMGYSEISDVCVEIRWSYDHLISSPGILLLMSLNSQIMLQINQTEYYILAGFLE